MAEKIAVRVTQKPGVVRNVDIAEFTDLARQGLIHSHEPIEGGPKSPNRWRPAEKKADVVEAPAQITDTKEG